MRTRPPPTRTRRLALATAAAVTVSTLDAFEAAVTGDTAEVVL